MRFVFPVVSCDVARAKLEDASANATGSKILVPKFVLSE